MTVTDTFHCARCRQMASVPLELPDDTSTLDVGLRVKEITAAGREIHEVTRHFDELVLP